MRANATFVARLANWTFAMSLPTLSLYLLEEGGNEVFLLILTLNVI